MATEKTKAQTAKLTSTKAKSFTPGKLTAESRAKARALPASKRPVMAAFRSSDGRATYAFDGVSIRRIQ